MKKFLFILTLGTLLLTMIGCGSVQNKTLVNAVVTDKNFVPSSSYITMVWTGKSSIPLTQYIPEEFNVTVSYEGITSTFDSREIYTLKEIGESIQVYKVDVYKKDGTFKRSYLQQQ